MQSFLFTIVSHDVHFYVAAMLQCELMYKLSVLMKIDNFIYFANTYPFKPVQKNNILLYKTGKKIFSSYWRHNNRLKNILFNIYFIRLLQYHNEFTYPCQITAFQILASLLRTNKQTDMVTLRNPTKFKVYKYVDSFYIYTHAYYLTNLKKIILNQRIHLIYLQDIYSVLISIQIT